MAESQVDRAVDQICELGCTVVSAYIAALQNGESRPEYQSLDAAQRAALLEELRSIMAVYEDQ